MKIKIRCEILSGEGCHYILHYCLFCKVHMAVILHSCNKDMAVLQPRFCSSVGMSVVSPPFSLSGNEQEGED